MNDLVECHSGATYPERPVALIWEGQRLEIVTILSEWRSPSGKMFRVHAKNDLQFLLTYMEGKDAWQIELIDISRPG